MNAVVIQNDPKEYAMNNSWLFPTLVKTNINPRNIEDHPSQYQNLSNIHFARLNGLGVIIKFSSCGLSEISVEEFVSLITETTINT